MTNFTGPSWDLSSEYLSPDDPAIDQDLARLQQLIEQIQRKSQALLPLISNQKSPQESDWISVIPVAREIQSYISSGRTLVRNVKTYANCRLSVDGRDAKAKVLEGNVKAIAATLQEATHAHSLFIKLAPDDVIMKYLSDERVQTTHFEVQRSRSKAHELLSLDQESLATVLSQDGIHAWGGLYQQLSGLIRCEIAEQDSVVSMGLAEAALRLQSGNDTTRERAWRAINDSWSAHEETCAAALNALAGWRINLNRQRSAQKNVHYLDQPIHDSRITSQTLDAILNVAKVSRPMSQRAASALAIGYGKNKLDPWDQRTPAPDMATQSSLIPFDEAINLIADACRNVHSSMGEFIELMSANQWIEGTVGPNKRPGAYCTSFPKSRTPRVYMTYAGTLNDVTTLAHELGHAFHQWTMRDLPESQLSYGMSLAETASTFAEAITRKALLNRAQTPEQKMQLVWEDVSAVTTFLLSIPTRFEFEQAFYERRKERPLLVTEIRELMCQAWTDWYGPALSEPDPLFWVSKLHFYMSETSFYNFPYLFGYLFSQAIFQRAESLGEAFFDKYQFLLRDTGRMTAEDLALKQLDVNLQDADFWQQTVSALEPCIAELELLNQEISPLS